MYLAVYVGYYYNAFYLSGNLECTMFLTLIWKNQHHCISRSFFVAECRKRQKSVLKKIFSISSSAALLKIWLKNVA